MIIYGTKAAKGKFVQTAVQCPFCGKEHAVGVLPFHKYFHVYWIPIIPYGKEYLSVCASCGKEVPEHYTAASLPEVRKQAKTPIWTYAGLLIVLIFVGAIFYSSTMSDSAQRNDALKSLHNPKVGDIFEIKDSENAYTLYQVTTIKSDSVYLQSSGKIVGSKKELKNLKKEAFSGDIKGYSQNGIFALYNSGQIIGVEKAK